MCLAVPGRIVSITGEDPLERNGKVDFGGVFRDVNLACVPEARVGDYVMVHVGLAISVVDEAEAREMLECLDLLNREAGEPFVESGRKRDKS
ncbi:MAG TPA: HypC/HybG/HupF family hydrogenase formation chaperone [Acidobacteriota bacterium]|jgi:hydrogenase expression/formation protein HypC|nr:HypC/HybG/HupF family hydrogenase formation chaperone [Acidobacteriota bacterium]